MAHSSTLKMESVHVTLSYRYALLAHTALPVHHYHFSISHIDSASLIFLYPSMSQSTVRRTRLLLNLCYTVLCVYFGLRVVERNEKNQIDFGIVLFCVLWKERANTYVINCFIETVLL